MRANSWLEGGVAWMLHHSLQAGVLVLLVLLVQWLFRRQLSSRWRFALWWVVLVRLLIPYGPESAISLFNFLRPPIVLRVPAVMVRVQPAVPTVPEAMPTYQAPRQVEAVELPQPASQPEPSVLPVQPPAVHHSEPTAPALNLKEWLMPGLAGLWVAGILALSVGVLVQLVRFGGRLARSSQPADAALQKLLAECRREFGVRRRIELIETDAVDSPALFGLFRLRLLLPRGITQRFSSREMRYIFMHEMAHVKRGDLWLNWLITALQIVHWFNPLVWLGFARLRADRELACDELALLRAGETVGTPYGETIVKLLEGLGSRTTIPGLVGILEDGQQMRRRILMIANFGKTSRSTALALILLAAIAATMLTDAQTQKTAAKSLPPVKDGEVSRPDLIGQIINKDGSPLAATVFISTAGPKSGTSIFCPSCYADCRKRASTDAQGNFKIKSLNPELRFRLLVVAKDYQPQFVSEVDPANGPVKVAMVKKERLAASPSNSLRGRVLDPKGQPIPHAIITVDVIHMADGTGYAGGDLPNVDPLAVADDEGRFVITARHPFLLMDVRIEARGFAPKKYSNLSSGSGIQDLILTEGSIVTGRVLFHGKPLSNVSVGINSAEKTMEDYTGHFEIGTDINGTFTFDNVPSDSEFYLYGLMDTVKPFGAIPLQKLHTGKDGETVQVGDLLVGPSQRIQGRVLLDDGTVIPQDTRLLLGREYTFDTLQLTLGRDGSFDTTGIPKGIVSLGVNISGYRFSDENLSLDWANEDKLVGRIDENITGLILLMAKEDVRPSGVSRPKPSRAVRPNNLPLRGAEALPDHERDWTLSGHILDAETKQPLNRFVITTGQSQNGTEVFEWNDSGASSGTNGQFVAYLSKYNPQPIMKAEADGYLPASISLIPRDASNLEILLKKGVGPSGTFLTPEGKPLPGRMVTLLYTGSILGRAPLKVKTDEKGHFSFKPQVGMVSVFTGSTEGFKAVSVESLSTNPIVRLEPFGQISGVLKRKSGLGRNEDLIARFAEEPNLGLSRSGAEYHARTDEQGRFKFSVPSTVKLVIGYHEKNVDSNVAQFIDLREVTVKPNASVEVNIETRDRLSVKESVLKNSPTPKPIVGSEIKGNVLLPNGKPAAGAEVALAVEGLNLALGKASFASPQLRDQGWIVDAGPDGGFKFKMHEGAKSIIAVDEEGYAEISLDKLKVSPQITLQKWGGIEGVLQKGGHSASNVQLAIQDRSPSFLAPAAFQTKTDQSGRFVFRYVPPVEITLVELVPIDERSSTYRLRGHLEIKPGETLVTNISDSGRTVIGTFKLASTNAPVDLKNAFLAFQQNTAWIWKRQALLKTKEEKMAFGESDEFKAATKNAWTYPVTFLPDGSFKGENVPTGKYELFLQIPGARFDSGVTLFTSSHDVVIPEAVIHSDDKPVDVGMIELNQPSEGTVPADVQPPKLPATRAEIARPDLVGQIVTKEGTPLAATVFISTAGPKIGTSTFCPSCYADCRKSTPTDALGTFKIESLDPKLRFRVLVVAKDYQPQFVSKVDPANGPIRVEMVKAERSAAKPGNSIRGRVLDPAGQPVAHAVVEMKGLQTKDGGGRWGVIENVDSLAVTDEAGEFVLTARDPFESMSVGVSARTFATKSFLKLASGTQRHDLTVAEGATVTGRVLLDGKPLKDISVGMVSVDRHMDNFTGNFDVGTDANGAFTFENIPPGVEYYIYGSMATLKAYGAIPVQKLRAGKDGETTKAGDLVVGPAHRLKGKVVLDDGGEVPANTQLLVSRAKAWDVLQITLEDDGSFDTQGIPSEGFSLSARIKGYRASAKNGSLDTLNPYGLVGQIDRDTTNLVFLMEKGPDLPPNYNMNKPQSEWPRNLPLRGAETLADHSLDWALSGRVLDAETKETIKNFVLTTGQSVNMLDMVDWDFLHSTVGSNGQFSIYISKRNTHPLLKAEAEGYLPVSTTLTPRNSKDIEILMNRGTGPRGTVLLPDGKPAIGIKVVLLRLGMQPVDLDAKGGLDAWRDQNMEVMTDDKGGFSFKPELGMIFVVAACPAGFKMVGMDELAATSTIILEPYGRITGMLKRKSGPGIKEELDVEFAKKATGPLIPISLQRHSTTDEQGRFEFDHVPAGSVTISYREYSGSIKGWQNVALREITLKPEETLDVNIETEDRPPVRQSGSAVNQPIAKPIIGEVIKGSVLLPNGKPAEGAEVALAVEGLYLALGKATFNAPQRRDEGLIVNTKSDGGFAFQMHEGAKSVMAVHEEGYAEVSLEKLKASPQIMLQKWGGIEGVLQKGGRAATNIKVTISHHPSVVDTNLSYLFDLTAFQTRTDEVGRFVFTYVPPSELSLFEIVPTGERSSMSLPRGHLVIKAGETLATNISISGRTVVGTLKFSGTNGAVDLKNASVSFRPPMTRFLKRLALLTTPEEKKAFMESEEIKSVKMNFWSYPASILPDGSFRAEVVPAGKYELNLHINDPHSSSETVMFTSVEEVVIPESKGETDGKPFDLGQIELQRFALPVIAQPPAQPSAATSKPAAALSPQQNESRASEGALERATEHQIEGIVLLPDGKAAVGAEVALDVEGGNLLLGKATLKSWKGNKKGAIVKTGADGGFRFQPTEGTKPVMAVHEEGYVKVSLEELKRSPQIKLQKWASIESVLNFEGRPATNMMLSVRSIDHVLPQFNQFASRVLTDDHGRFSFNYLPPSEYRLSRVLKVSDQQTTFDEFSQFTLQAGETLVTNFGGNTRTVVGRLSFRKGEEFSSFQNAVVGLHKNAASARKLLARFKTHEELKAFNDTDEWRNVSYDYLHHTGELGRHGTFRAVGVSEGKYEVQLETKDEIYRSSAEITIKPGAEENGFVPLDIGVIELKKVDFSKQGLNEANN